ncbi:MAG TPA: alanine--tRNA ligase [bacterium]|nr:alanine--tRNA ligase [bacterium]
MKASDIRERYLSFFESKEHLRHPSASLVPDDPTLLTTSAGMVPFKPYFLGLKTPPKTRLTTSQKCLRAKDLEEVGRTPRHHTFFEMLGNFSFGDYFKREIITWAWELLTEYFEIPVERLRVSVYEEDDEARSIWTDEVGVSKENLYRFGESENYWPASAPSKGPNGPCGPCSEIFYDFGPERGCGKPGCDPSCDCERYIEIWNLVFMQFERHDGGKLTPLPKKNIDTGSGLERMASVLQGTRTNFETDLFIPLIQKIEDISGLKYDDSPVPFRVISDHIRGAGFLISDGVFPSNEGRGYLLRKLIRRAATNGHELGLEKPFLSDMVPVVADVLGAVYPEFAEQVNFVSTIINKEEEQFMEALQQGRIFVINSKDEMETEVGGRKLADGNIIFTAYDTYGLPIEEAEKIVAEMGLDGIDMDGFKKAMAEQKERSRKGSKMDGSVFAEDEEKVYRDIIEEKEAGLFDGYDKIEMESSIVAIISGGVNKSQAAKDEEVDIIVDKTPFYGEMGGQIGDSGRARTDGAVIVITDAFTVEGRVIHKSKILEGEIKTGDTLKMMVTPERRDLIMRHHTATHLLHAALREVLGTHVHQAGSYVGPDKLRFDFTHHSGITPDELSRIENITNEKILACLPVETTITDFETAKNDGAMALFGEKYGAEVRMVDIPGFSKELCGGTHVGNTCEIGIVKITDERTIGSSMRRIEAVAGSEALKFINERIAALKASASILKVKDTDVPGAVQTLSNDRDRLQREMKKASKTDVHDRSREIIESAEKFGETNIIAAALESLDVDALRSLFDEIKVKFESFAVLLGSNTEGKASLLLAFSDDLTGRGLDAGKLIKEIARYAKGGGGGSKSMAQAGGKDGESIPVAIEKGVETIKGVLS